MGCLQRRNQVRAVGGLLILLFVKSVTVGAVTRSMPSTNHDPKSMTNKTNQPRLVGTANSGLSTSGVRANLESYHDLVEKARNLTLQRDRLQASQVLQRGLQREPKNSSGYRELAKALDDLTDLFYTEKGQTLFAQADGLMENKPREALEALQSALRIEDGNLTILRMLARTHLVLGDCDRAESVVTQADGLNPVNAEIRLLRLQVADCQKNAEKFAELSVMTDVDLSSVEKYVRSLQIKDALQRKENKKARVLVSSLEQMGGDYPEIHFWRWRLSMDQSFPDRTAALTYLQVCQNLSPRQKKVHSLDLDLCAGREKVEEYLRTSSLREQSATNVE